MLGLICEMLIRFKYPIIIAILVFFLFLAFVTAPARAETAGELADKLLKEACKKHSAFCMDRNPNDPGGPY